MEGKDKRREEERRKQEGKEEEAGREEMGNRAAVQRSVERSDQDSVRGKGRSPELSWVSVLDGFTRPTWQG